MQNFAKTNRTDFLFNDQLDAQLFFVYVYFSSLHVSNIQVLINRRFSCTKTISGICHSMQVTVWYTGLNRLVYRFGDVQTCIPDGHLHRVIYTRYIDTNESPDDNHLNVRNMQRTEINITQEKNCASRWSLIRKLYRYARSGEHKKHSEFVELLYLLQNQGYAPYSNKNQFTYQAVQANTWLRSSEKVQNVISNPNNLLVNS